MEFHVPQHRIRIFIPGFDSNPSGLKPPTSFFWAECFCIYPIYICTFFLNQCMAWYHWYYWDVLWDLAISEKDHPVVSPIYLLVHVQRCHHDTNFAGCPMYVVLKREVVKMIVTLPPETGHYCNDCCFQLVSIERCWFCMGENASSKPW